MFEEVCLAGVGYQQQYPAAQQFPAAFVPQYGLAQLGGMQQMPQQRVGLPAEGTFYQPSQQLQQQQQQRQLRQQQQPRQIRQQQQPRPPGPVSRQPPPPQPPAQRAQPRPQPPGRSSGQQGAVHLTCPACMVECALWRHYTCLYVCCWVDQATTSKTTTSNTLARF